MLYFVTKIQFVLIEIATEILGLSRNDVIFLGEGSVDPSKPKDDSKKVKVMTGYYIGGASLKMTKGEGGSQTYI